MGKLLLAGLVVFSSLAVPATQAQTPYNLPNSLCAIQASDYVFCSQMGTVKINGTNYGVTMTARIPDIYQYPASGTISSVTVTLINWGTDTPMDLTATGTYDDHHFTLNFSGAFTGTLKFGFIRTYPTPPCGRWCWLAHYNAENVVLVLQ